MESFLSFSMQIKKPVLRGRVSSGEGPRRRLGRFGGATVNAREGEEIRGGLQIPTSVSVMLCRCAKPVTSAAITTFLRQPVVFGPVTTPSGPFLGIGIKAICPRMAILVCPLSMPSEQNSGLRIAV